MRIFVNAIATRTGGAMTVLGPLLQALAQASLNDEIQVLVRPEIAERLPSLPANVTEMPLAMNGSSAAGRLLWENTGLRRLVAESRADVLLSSGNFPMIFPPCRQCVMYRNMLYASPLVFQMARQASATSYAELVLKRWAARSTLPFADAVIVESETMKAALVEQFRIPAERVFVVYNGFVDGADELRGMRGEPEAVREPRSPYEVPHGHRGERVVLTVGHYGIHKNYETIARAAAILQKKESCEARETTRFRWIGEFDTEAPTFAGYSQIRGRKALEGLLDSLAVREFIEICGQLDHKATLRHYRRAACFVYGSVCEAFPNPLVEAMAAGLPIIAADTATNRELCGDAAAYFPAFDAEQLARLIPHVLESPALAQRLGQAGFERAKAFSWAKAGAAYHEILSGIAKAK